MHGRTDDLAKADVIIPDVDLGNPHYPSFLAEAHSYPAGRDAFCERRGHRMSALLRQIDTLLPTLASAQRVLLVDLESDHEPSSACAHWFKAGLPAAQRAKLIHASLCATESNYRAGLDVSFPAVLPASLGDERVRGVPTRQRAVLMSFKGRRTHGLRQALFLLHNGRDRVCIDSTDERAAARRRGGGADPVDESAARLHGRSRFSLCPRGDAAYSFRFIEALSCGAVPVLYGDGWVLPFSEALDYDAFAVLIPEAEVHRTVEILAAIDDEGGVVEAMQAAGRRVFEAVFATLDAQCAALLAIVRLRMSPATSEAARTRHQVCGRRTAGCASPRGRARREPLLLDPLGHALGPSSPRQLTTTCAAPQPLSAAACAGRAATTAARQHRGQPHRTCRRGGRVRAEFHEVARACCPSGPSASPQRAVASGLSGAGE